MKKSEIRLKSEKFPSLLNNLYEWWDMLYESLDTYGEVDEPGPLVIHLRLKTDHPCLSVGVCDLEGRALRAVVDQVVGERPGCLVTVCGQHLFDLRPRLGRLRYTRAVRRVRDEARRVVVHVVQHDGQLGWMDRDGLALMSVLHSERLLHVSIISIYRYIITNDCPALHVCIDRGPMKSYVTEHAGLLPASKIAYFSIAYEYCTQELIMNRK